MLGDVDEIRSALVARLTAAFTEEIDRRDPESAIPWDRWPTVAAMIDHLGRINQWVARIVSTGKPVDRAALSRAPLTGVREWYERCRMQLLEALADTPADRPCWVLGDRSDGTAGFWRRRMVFETVKHLIDLRAAGGGQWAVAAELAPVDYVDGVDELFSEFLPRSSHALDALPGTLTLAASDAERRWTIAPDWTLQADERDVGARVVGTAGDLALLVWERAAPGDARFHIDGDEAIVRAFSAAPVHP